MARTRKSVLGENPFASGEEAAAAPSSAKKPSRRKATKQGGVGPAKPKSSKKPAKRTGKAKSSAPSETEAVRSKPKSAKSTKPTKPAKPTKPTEPRPKARKNRAKATPESVAQESGQAVPDTAVSVAADAGVSEAGQRARQQRIAAQIRELESRTDAGEDPGLQASRGLDEQDRLGFEPPGGEAGGMFDAARELLSSDYYLRQWGRLGMRNRSAEVDDFGHDAKYDARFQPLLDVLYERYFRVVTEGVENIPEEGRVLIVANHAGTFPYDGIMLKTAVRHEHAKQRNVRWLAEDHLFYMPFVGSFLNRMGAVRACQENAERLLRQERLVAVFPEGAKGTGRLFRNRHKLQRFGRGGFVRLCLRTQTPIVPCVIVGAEEAMPLLFRIEYLANLLGIPYIPITPTFPVLGPLGVLPAPTKWQFTFGEPIRFERYTAQDADDHVLVRRLTERVRATMQGMLDQVSSSRRSPWFG